MRINQEHSYIVLRADTSDIYIRELHTLEEYLYALISIGYIYYNTANSRRISYSCIDDVRNLVSEISIQILENNRISSILADIYTDGKQYQFMFGNFDENSFVSEVKKECLAFIKPIYKKRLNSVSSLEDLNRLLAKTKYF